MALILPCPKIQASYRLNRSTTTVDILDEYFRKATLRNPYAEFVLDLPGLNRVIDDAGDNWLVSSIVFGMVEHGSFAGGMTITQMKDTNGRNRAHFLKFVKSELTSVAYNAKDSHGKVYVEFDSSYELRGIAGKMIHQNQFGSTASFAIVGMRATLFGLSEQMKGDLDAYEMSEFNAHRAALLAREREYEDCDRLLTGAFLKYLCYTLDCDLASLQQDRECWHKYLQGQYLRQEALREFEKKSRS